MLGVIPETESEDAQSVRNSAESLSNNDAEDEDSDAEDAFTIREMQSAQAPATYPQFFFCVGGKLL
eukprot:6891956-Karenia_brevis.AAC.1